MSESWVPTEPWSATEWPRIIEKIRQDSHRLGLRIRIELGKHTEHTLREKDDRSGGADELMNSPLSLNEKQGGT
jgi:hypothetical protein